MGIHERKKKGGGRKEKKLQAMREDVKQRKERGEPNQKEAGLHSDQGDMYPKPNAEMNG